MGRPSMQKQREAEVLDAFMSVVARYGVEGATLERVADASGLKRPLIRHYLGNRDEMVHALAKYVVDRQIAAINELRVAMKNYPGINNFIDTLFSEHGSSDGTLNNAYQALIAAVEHYPDLRAPLLHVMSEFYDLAADIVGQHAPGTPKKEVRAVAHGIVDLYLAIDALAPLSPPDDWGYASYEGALRLARSLSV